MSDHYTGPVRSDLESWSACVWGALEDYRDKCIPEGSKSNDAQWDDICTSMAWLREEVGLPDEASIEAGAR